MHGDEQSCIKAVKGRGNVLEQANKSMTCVITNLIGSFERSGSVVVEERCIGVQIQRLVLPGDWVY